MLKILAKLKGLRRTPGEEGRLKYVERPGGFKLYMDPDWSTLGPYPTSKYFRSRGVDGQGGWLTLRGDSYEGYVGWRGLRCGGGGNLNQIDWERVGFIWSAS